VPAAALTLEAAASRVPARRFSRSLIAAANALMRMKESSRAPGARILDDPWAGELADDHWLLSLIRFGRFVLPPLKRTIDELQTAHCVRHRSIDELVLAAVERDRFTQVVMVGAGYDMRAARFAERLRGARVIEVDLPEIGARKRALLGDHCPEQVAADLSSESLGRALERSSFDPSAPAVFVMEGLIHYLSPESLSSLFSDVARGPGARRAIFSFIRPDVFERASGPLKWLFGLVREIPRASFTRDQLRALCERHGLPAFASWQYAEQVATFAPIARGRRVGSTQDVARADGDGIK
jgi:methyltransferase (TIGR00027 family)